MGEKNIQGTAEKEGKTHLFLERERSNTQKQQVTAVTVVTMPQTHDHLYGFQPLLSTAFNPTLTPSEPPLSSKIDTHRFLQLQKSSMEPLTEGLCQNQSLHGMLWDLSWKLW